MSKQIDEKVVSMEFDNKRFESNVKTSMRTIDKLNIGDDIVHLDVSKVGPNYKKLVKQIKDLQTQVNLLRDKLLNVYDKEQISNIIDNIKTTNTTNSNVDFDFNSIFIDMQNQLKLELQNYVRKEVLNNYVTKDTLDAYLKHLDTTEQ